MIQILVITLTLVAFVGLMWRRLHLPAPYGDRICQGKDWRRAFPNISKQEIRKFLILVMNSFAFSVKEKLKVNPDDRVMDIYRAINPIKDMPDVLELETLALQVKKVYNLELQKIWNERVTLGNLFSECLMSQSRENRHRLARD